MRRTLLVMWASALMVVLMGASALPAFAQVGWDPEEESDSENEYIEQGAVFVIPALLGGGAGALLLRRNNRR
jgi:hypothetical protein